MKRNWKLDFSVPIGTRLLWKGDPSRLVCPWVRIDVDKLLGHGQVLNKGYNYIQKVSNLEWLEQQVDKNQNYNKV